MALRDQNPKNLAFASKVDWSVAWVEILRGQVWRLEQNGGGGGSTEITIGEPVTGGTPNRMLFIDGDGNVAVSESYQADNAFGNFVVEGGSLSVNINGGNSFNIVPVDSYISSTTTGGGRLDLNFPTNAGHEDINFPEDSTGTVALQEWVNGQKGIVNGIASLDSGGTVPIDQLPFSVAEYRGTWNADTNTPTLVDGVGDNGDFYVVSVGGTQNLGSGSITFAAGNLAIYNGATGEWEKAGGLATGTVTSVSSADNTRATVANGSTTPVIDIVSSPKLQTARNINNIAFDGTDNILLNSTYNNQTGTTYTFAIADNQKIVTATNASAQTYTVPTNASVAFLIGTRIDVIQLGAGKVTIAPASGTVTINSYNNNTSIAGQYVGVTLLKTDTNTWVLVGNLIT